MSASLFKEQWVLSSHIVVIVCVGSQNAPQMRFAPNDDMIETLTPDRPDQSFGKAILPAKCAYKKFVEYADRDITGSGARHEAPIR